jgi:3-dehydroquinate dehydratase II
MSKLAQIAHPNRSNVMSKTVFLINGPNLNLLGKREPDIYGHDTLDDVAARCTALTDAAGLALKKMQSNHEGQIIDWIHQARDEAAAIVINPGAFTHTSVAIFDALQAFEGLVFEVHISNVHKREAFRHHSYVSSRADGVLAGFGVEGYELAMRRVISLLG